MEKCNLDLVLLGLCNQQSDHVQKEKVGQVNAELGWGSCSSEAGVIDRENNYLYYTYISYTMNKQGQVLVNGQSQGPVIQLTTDSEVFYDISSSPDSTATWARSLSLMHSLNPSI